MIEPLSLTANGSNSTSENTAVTTTEQLGKNSVGGSHKKDPKQMQKSVKAASMAR